MLFNLEITVFLTNKQTNEQIFKRISKLDGAIHVHEG